MLILTRKPGEAIVLGDDITVRVLSIDGARVKLGIEAPRSVSVVRKELLDAVRQSNLEAIAHVGTEIQIPAAFGEIIKRKVG